MEWYSGEVTEAIQETQKYGKTFVVFIEGDDDNSKEMLQKWDDKHVISICNREKCVPLKLQAESEQGVMFSKCYPVICIPSTFIINGGVPVDIIAGIVTSDELANRLSTAVKQNVISQNKNPMVSSGEESSAGVLASSDTAVPGASSTSTAGNDDFQNRVAHAQELIRVRQEQKYVEEINEAKSKELKRRQEGNEFSLAKKQKADKEAKKLADEMSKRKSDEKLAREAVRQKIKQDRAERAAKYENEKTAAEAIRKTEIERQERLKGVEPKPVDMSRTRLQFRLPDGSTTNREFDSKETLDVAYRFICEHCAGKFGQIRLVTVHPRREFNEKDMQLTFADLKLTPSSTIIVLPTTRSSSLNSSGFTSAIDLVRVILSPLVMLFMWILSVFGLSNTGNTKPPAGTARQQQQHEISSSSSNTDQSSVRRRTRPDGSNVHRIRNQEDDDDKDKKTWNGNSTQQM